MRAPSIGRLARRPQGKTLFPGRRRDRNKDDNDAFCNFFAGNFLAGRNPRRSQAPSLRVSDRMRRTARIKPGQSPRR